MWNKRATILSILLLCSIAVDKSEAPNAAASASAAATAGYLSHEPVQQNPVVDSFAKLISDGLLHSPVFGDFANFQVYDPYDLIFIAGTNALAEAGIHDPALAKIDADAAKEVGLLDSKLYFDSIGYMTAIFLFAKDVITIENVEYFSLRIVTSIEVVACTDGLIDTQSVLDATVYGLFYVLDSYGLTSYENMADLFYLFAALIKELAGIASK